MSRDSSYALPSLFMLSGVCLIHIAFRILLAPSWIPLWEACPPSLSHDFFSAHMVCNFPFIVSLFRFVFFWANDFLLHFLVTVLLYVHLFWYPVVCLSHLCKVLDWIDTWLCRLPGLCLAPQLVFRVAVTMFFITLLTASESPLTYGMTTDNFFGKSYACLFWLFVYIYIFL